MGPLRRRAREELAVDDLLLWLLDLGFGELYWLLRVDALSFAGLALGQDVGDLDVASFSGVLIASIGWGGGALSFGERVALCL